MKKNTNQPKAVQGTAVAKAEQKAEDANTNALVILKPSEESPEDLRAENERLKRIVDSVPTSFEERVAYYNQKKDWIKKFRHISEQEAKLQEVLGELAEEIANDEFITENFLIKVSRKNKFGSDNDILVMHNPVFVADLMHVVLKRMRDKLDELQINIAS